MNGTIGMNSQALLASCAGLIAELLALASLDNADDTQAKRVKAQAVEVLEQLNRVAPPIKAQVRARQRPRGGGDPHGWATHFANAGALRRG